VTPAQEVAVIQPTPHGRAWKHVVDCAPNFRHALPRVGDQTPILGTSPCSRDPAIEAGTHTMLHIQPDREPVAADDIKDIAAMA
jgi:hypothetical protein